MKDSFRKWFTDRRLVTSTTQLMTPATPRIPTRADYAGSQHLAWNEIPLGLGAEGEVIVDLKASPNILLCGVTGSGKSFVQRNMFFHCAQYPDDWLVYGIDMKRVELTPYAELPNVVSLAQHLDEAVDMLRDLDAIMKARYTALRASPASNLDDFNAQNTTHVPRIMVVVDEAFMLVAPEGGKTYDSAVRDVLHGIARGYIGDLARHGRVAGIHLVLGTQRPDSRVFGADLLKINLGARITVGKLAPHASRVVLDGSLEAAEIPGGRASMMWGILQANGHKTNFRAYHSDANWAKKNL